MHARCEVLLQVLDGGEGHADSSFHVEDAGTPYSFLIDAKGHGLEGAQRPDGIEMAEQQDGLRAPAAFPEADFEVVSAVELAVSADATVQSFGVGGGLVDAAIYGGFFVARRLNFDK
jgi:hypothetical protein